MPTRLPIEGSYLPHLGEMTTKLNETVQEFGPLFLSGVLQVVNQQMETVGWFVYEDDAVVFYAQEEHPFTGERSGIRKVG